MTRQLKAIFDSSTISTNSESMNIKSEPVFYVNKGTDGRYQDSKKTAAEMVLVHIHGIVIEVTEISTQGMATDIIVTCYTEVVTMDRKKISTIGGKKQTH